MMDTRIALPSCSFLSCSFLLVTCISTAQAASYDHRDRAGSTDIALRLNYLEEESYSGPEGTKIEVQDEMGFGFGAMYNVDAHWAFGGSFDGSSSDYRATAIPDSDPSFVYFNQLDSYSINFDAIYYFLDNHITPYVTASIGWTEIDSNIPTGPGYPVCWWDWWGYYCDYHTPSKEEGGFNYKAGVGLRWDISRNFAVRGSYSYSEVDIDVAGDNPSNSIWRLEFVAPM
ncbi:MAG: outer membrane beta-barrel protein [Ketobacter sp.]|nr:MAG: porin family protein [Ketobacter sp.]